MIETLPRLRITEIFYSLQGETRTVGLPTAFIRLSGCPLRCVYCDTDYAFQGGQLLSIQEILTMLKVHSPRYVTVTGGEPLAQPPCLSLLTTLADEGYEVSLETSGAIDIRRVDPRITIVMDIKTPGSNEAHRNKLENLDFLKPIDQIKFVICNREDYLFSKNLLAKYDLSRFEVLFSPAYGEMENKTLADWIIEDKLPVRFQIQLHKYIWGNVPGK